MTISSGAQLGPYEILSQLGAGGMGEVYRARDTRLNREVAIKVLPASLADDADRLLRFAQEAQSASALNHPNIITIHEVGEIEGLHFIVTELIDGNTLRRKMAAEQLSLPAALDLAMQIASALAAAHEAGITHRDIKPDNIMVRRDGIVKVLDFGLAKLTERQPPTEIDVDAATRAKMTTDPGAVMGTPQYMSPEQARGQRVDARTDLFSLGVVLYEMIAGRPPFDGVNALDVISAILQKEPPPLKSHAPEIPAELQRIVAKALRKDRNERYQTARDLLNDLKDLKEELSFAAKQTRSDQTEREQTVTASAEAMPTAAGAALPTTSSAKIILGEIKRHKLGVALMLMLLLAVMGALGYFAFLARPASGPIDSLAVLPFQNRSSDADSEYLSDGLAESLIHRLSQLPNLKVSPTSSVFRYKGRETDPAKIGHELSVQAVMTGRILQRGDNLTIGVELVDVRNNKVLWGEQYERKLSELLATQREMVAEITNNLKLKLSGAGEKALTKRYTDNNEAYQLYLKGRFYFARRTKEDLQRSIELFQQAIKLDSNFALAYVGIAEAYAVMPSYPYMSPKEAFPQAKAAIAKALKLDPDLPEAHTVAGYIASGFDWDWAEAERHFKRSLELDPNLAITHYRYGFTYLTALGRHDEAIAEMKKAMELEPLSLIQGANFAAVLIYARQFDAALEQAKKTYELDPNHVGGRHWMSHALNAKGMYAESLLISEKSLQSGFPVGAQLGYAYAKSGQRQKAEAVIARLKEDEKTKYVMNYWVAIIYAALGEKDAAFAELEKAYQARDWFLPRLKTDPFMDPLRDDPRLADLMRRLGLPK
jgi:serine/threonine-protein kinase